MGWDGLRPDLVNASVTPNLHGLSERGTWFTRPTAVFPAETRPNNATIGTGCQPGRHGITANHVLVDGRDVDTGKPDEMLALGERFGRILRTPTLGEVLAAEGRQLATLGSGSPGQTLLQNPHGVGSMINRAIRIPGSLDAEIAKRFGPWPERPRNRDYGPTDDYLLRVATEYVIPELDPAVLVLWSCEPDVALHAKGLGSPEMSAVLRANDGRLGSLLARLDLSTTAVIFMSDHGHSTVRRRVDVAASLPLGEGEYKLVGEGIQVAESNIAKVASALAAQAWCGPVFVHDLHWREEYADFAAPTSVLWGGDPGTWTPPIQFSMGWDDRRNANGVPGHNYKRLTDGPPLATDHGTLSPRDMGNTLLMAGAGIRQGFKATGPAGVVDIAPTILDVLGLDVPDFMQGRPLTEALVDGEAPPEPETEILLEGHWGALIRQRVGRSSYVGVA